MRRRLTLLSLCLGLFLAQTDTTAVNLALPAMARDLAAKQWVMDAYHLAFAALLLTGGTLGDRFGRRRLFRIGLVLFVAGSVLCTLGPALVPGRALQGAGAGLAIPQSLGLMSVVFAPGRDRDRAMAAWSAVTGIALASGPILGGLLVEQVGWRYIFWLNVPLGLAALALTVAVPESSAGTTRGLDPLGQALGIVFLGTLTYAVIESSVVIGLLAVASGVAFVLAERRDNAMLPLHLVRRGQTPVAATVALCMTFGMYGMLLLASVVLQRDHGALQAGLILLPMPVLVVVGSPLTGRLVTRFGPRTPMTAGMVLMGAGLAAFGVTGTREPWLEVILGILGAGLALTAGPVVGVAVSAVSADRAGLAGGIANLARMFGAALGVAVLGAVFAHSGLRPALYTGAAVELAGAVVAVRGVQRRPRNAAAADTAGLDESEPRSSTENATSPR
ncbi:MAG TPA: MFS transporter [Amycolatopsis sp.]|nr:MFS transporter [Amycolatopsis sp.]